MILFNLFNIKPFFSPGREGFFFRHINFRSMASGQECQNGVNVSQVPFHRGPLGISNWTFLVLLAFLPIPELAAAPRGDCDHLACFEETTSKIRLQNRIYFSVGIVETSHVGGFDRYVGPWVKKRVKKFFGIDKKKKSSGGGSGGGKGLGKLFDIILPDGKLPDDFAWVYKFRPGLKLALDYESNLFYQITGRPVHLTAFAIYDQTEVILKAPTGFGILIDPTRAKLHADFYGVGLKVSAPVFTAKIGNWLWDTQLGGGVFAYHSRSYYHVTSAFLNIFSKETRNRVKALISFSSTLYQPMFPSAGPATDIGRRTNISFELDMFQTDYFWTATASLNAKFRF